MPEESTVKNEAIQLTLDRSFEHRNSESNLKLSNRGSTVNAQIYMDENGVRRSVVGNSQSHPLYMQARSMMMALCKVMNPESSRVHVMDYLQDQHMQATLSNNTKLAESIRHMSVILRLIATLGFLTKKESTDDMYDMFLWDCAMECIQKRNKNVNIGKRMAVIENALSSIEKHHKNLLDKLEAYQMYLDSVSGGNFNKQQEQKEKEKQKKGNIFSKTFASSKPKEQKDKPRQKLVTHKVLEDLGIVVKTSDEIGKDILARLEYDFTELAFGSYSVGIKAKFGIEVSVLKEPLKLKLVELLQKQSQGETYIVLEYVTLNMNLLIHFLNKNFPVIN
jgi:hypothetical protein